MSDKENRLRKGAESSKGIESVFTQKKVRIKTSQGRKKSYMRQLIISNVVVGRACEDRILDTVIKKINVRKWRAD